jgi:hypothetical protein
MTRRRGVNVEAIHQLRRSAAAIVALSDSVIFGGKTTAAADLRVFPARIRALQARCERALEALAREGIV